MGWTYAHSNHLEAGRKYLISNFTYVRGLLHRPDLGDVIINNCILFFYNSFKFSQWASVSFASG